MILCSVYIPQIRRKTNECVGTNPCVRTDVELKDEDTNEENC